MPRGTLSRTAACIAAILTTVAVARAVLRAQAPPALAIDVSVPTPPHPFRIGDVTHFVYELHITNFSTLATALDRITVLDRNAPDAPPLLTLQGDALLSAVRPIGSSARGAGRTQVPAGGSVVVFVWVTTSGSKPPTALTHRLDIRDAQLQPYSATAANAQVRPPVTIRGVDVAVAKDTPVIIGPPLKGDLWLAANAPGNAVGHRRALMTLSGQVRIPERFAIDWVRLFDDGPAFHGDPLNNASFRAYGSEALAVANGIVVNVVDGLPENVPDPSKRAVVITPETVGGNLVTLDIGRQRYVTYAHFQPRSLRVKKGDRVRQGQVLGLVGNSGNSTEPHLHLQITDGPAAFDSEGVPFAFSSFGLQAPSPEVEKALRPAGNSIALDREQVARWKSAPAVVHKNEMPLDGALLSFLQP